MSEKTYPQDLIKAFVKCKKADWDSDVKYKKYRKLADSYLKGKAEDAIDQGKLIVDLTRATIHLFEVIDDGEKEETEVKRAKKLVGRPRKVPQLGGSDGEQTEEKRTQEVAQQSEGG